MMCKTPVKLFASVCSLLFVLPFLIKSLDVSAETYNKMTASDLHNLIGNSIPFTYKVNGIPYNGTFVYSSNIDFYTIRQTTSFNVSDNPVFGVNVLQNYEGCWYYFRTSYSTQTYFTDIDIQLNFDYFGGARGGFMLGQSWSIADITNSGNAVNVGGNYCGNFPIITGNTQADSSLSNYYGVVNIGSNNVNYRPLYYDGTNFSIHHIYYNSIATRALPNIGNSSSTYRYLLLYVVAPYTYGNYDVSVNEPAVTTTTATGTSPSTDINVSVYIDNSAIESQLDEYLGADDTRITTYETINLGTFPTFDYNNATETVNVSQVISETSDGINSIWYIISGLFGSAPLLVWLVPFCIFMSILSFVLWRKGG